MYYIVIKCKGSKSDAFPSNILRRLARSSPLSLPAARHHVERADAGDGLLARAAGGPRAAAAATARSEPEPLQAEQGSAALFG